MSDQQQAFIQMISNRLGRPMPSEKPLHPFKGAPDFWKTYELDLEQRIDLFRDNWAKSGGHSFRFSTMDDVKRFIGEQTQSLQARQVLQQNQPELLALLLKEHLSSCKVMTWSPGSRDELVAHAASADIGISMVDHAVAHTGSIVVTSSGNTGRSVSLLPTVFFAIVPVDRLKTRLGEALATYDGRPRKHFPAGIHFISGPSRSADIENDLTIGVHGPGVVFALLVG